MQHTLIMLTHIVGIGNMSNIVDFQLMAFGYVALIFSKNI